MEKLYSKNHIWLSNDEGNIWRIGLTDYAQQKLGTVMFINLPFIGDEIVSDVSFGDVESIKTVSDLIAPCSGKVVDVNDDLIDNTSLINKSPNESWIIKIEVSNIGELMSEKDYFGLVDSI